MPDLHLLTTEQYYQALLRQIPQAKKRVVIAAMIVLWGERTAPILAMLKDAVQRGVQVTILLDNYTRLPSLYGLQPRSSRKDRVRQTFRALEDLSRDGAQVYCFGKIGFPPYKGRCHVKITVVDDTSYSFGGVNFYDQMFGGQIDYMLCSKSSDVADCLEQLVKRIGSSHPPLPDGEVPIGKDTTVLFDGGQPGRSLIYERACELSSQAQRVHFVGWATPSGPLCKLLDETKSTFYYNRPERMIRPESWAQAFDEQRYRVDNSYQGKGFIHAKYMLFELPGGKKALLSGSHNFSYRGVSFGTQEITVYSTNPALWQELHAFLQKHIARTA